MKTIKYYISKINDIDIAKEKLDRLSDKIEYDENLSCFINDIDDVTLLLDEYSKMLLDKPVDKE